MEIDKNAYWVARQPMRAISDADRAKLQRRSMLQTPSVPTFEKKTPISSLDPELRDIFEQKSKFQSSAFFKPVAEAVTDAPDVPEVEPETPTFLEQSASALPTAEQDKNELASNDMKKTSTLLTRTLIFTERRRKEGRGSVSPPNVAIKKASTSLPDPFNETDDAVVMEDVSVTPAIAPEVELQEKETPADTADADTAASFPKTTDTSFSSVDLTDRAPDNPWSRPNDIIAQLKQLSHVVVHMISSEERREEEKDDTSDQRTPIYSDPLKDTDKAKLKWYERPFKEHPFEYLPKPSPRFNCLCPGIVDF